MIRRRDILTPIFLIKPPWMAIRILTITYIPSPEYQPISPVYGSDPILHERELLFIPVTPIDLTHSWGLGIKLYTFIVIINIQYRIRHVISSIIPANAPKSIFAFSKKGYRAFIRILAYQLHTSPSSILLKYSTTGELSNPRSLQISIASYLSAKLYLLILSSNTSPLNTDT